MDSLTQIVLGAACGEIALGRKIGNKALLFGAIGGTIPDLDVILGSMFFDNSIDELLFHRGFMHSFVFAFLSPFIFGSLTFNLYNLGKRKNTTLLKDWILLYFLSIFTHPILDSFTPYGTELFNPFTHYRVAFNTIAVADPLYTFPFLFCLIMVMCFKRNHKRRLYWNKLGIYISSVYLLLTVANKFYMDTVFEKSFTENSKDIQRFSTQPTILNNILWYGIAETKTDYKIGYYSLLDTQKKVDTIVSITKNHKLLNMSNPDLQQLSWFSNRYYNLNPIYNSTMIRYDDLRYPLVNFKDPNSTGVFSFELEKNNNRWEINRFSESTQKDIDINKVFKQLWVRLKGI